MNAYLDEHGYRNVVSFADVERVIAEVRLQARPTMIFLEQDGGSTLVFGIGSDDSVLTFADSEGVTFHSVGNVKRKGILRFWCRDQLDDFFAEMAVPEALAVAAAREFLSTGRRPTSIVWEPDW